MNILSLAMTERMDTKGLLESAKVFRWENVTKFQQKTVWQWMTHNVSWSQPKNVIKWTPLNVIRFQTRSCNSIFSCDDNSRKPSPYVSESFKNFYFRFATNQFWMIVPTMTLKSARKSPTNNVQGCQKRFAERLKRKLPDGVNTNCLFVTFLISRVY